MRYEFFFPWKFAYFLSSSFKKKTNIFLYIKKFTYELIMNSMQEIL